jgi:hypothetical protein
MSSTTTTQQSTTLTIRNNFQQAIQLLTTTIPSTLTSLSIENCPELGTVTLTSLSTLANLTEFTLTGCKIRDVTTLCEGLQHDSCKISMLFLFGNEIDDANTIRLAHALQKNTSVKILHLWKNNIGDAGAIALAQLLFAGMHSGHNHRPSSLEVLSLAENHIGDEGAQRIAFALRTNQRLKFCSLFKNQFTNTCLQSWLITLKLNGTLKELEYDRNRELLRESMLQLDRALSDPKRGTLSVPVGHTLFSWLGG